LDPITSAGIIIQHVSDGVELARKYRIPKRIRDFIVEHHGTMIARYQYAKALEAAGGDESQVDIELFRYPGPRPRSRETAILMLADGSEARVRAERPKDEEAMLQVVKSVIENRISQGQLDETELTLEELDQITESFTSTLRGMYHPRIEYPIIERSAASQVDTVPVPRAPVSLNSEPAKASAVDPSAPTPEQP
jgi:membrane-associated HD superfamily phosphohydrolase